YLDAPDLHPDQAGGQFYLHLEVQSGGIADGLHGKREEIVHRIPLLLPSVRIEVLPEITSLVKQADPNQRNGAIAGGFQVIAGKNAESAGIDRETLGEPVFGGEVGDQSVTSRLFRLDQRV